MKRFLPLFALIGLCGLAVPLLTASDGEKSDSDRHHHPCRPVSGSICDGGFGGATPATRDPLLGDGPPTPRSIDAQVVQELTTILNETTSREAYVYTVGVLGKMGRSARPALPAIIRNAERLRLFTPNARGSEDYLSIMNEAIDCILERHPVSPVQVTAKVNAPAPSLAAPAPQPAPAAAPVTRASHVCRPAPAAAQSAPPPLAAPLAP